MYISRDTFNFPLLSIVRLVTVPRNGEGGIVNKGVKVEEILFSIRTQECWQSELRMGIESWWTGHCYPRKETTAKISSKKDEMSFFRNVHTRNPPSAHFSHLSTNHTLLHCLPLLLPHLVGPNCFPLNFIHPRQCVLDSVQGKVCSVEVQEMFVFTWKFEDMNGRQCTRW